MASRWEDEQVRMMDYNHEVQSGKGNPQTGNFIAQVISRLDVHDDGEVIPSVKLKFAFDDGTESEETIVALKELDKSEFRDIHPKCLINPTIRKAKEIIAYNIRTAMINAPKEAPMYSISRVGTHVIEGVPVFYTGEQLICSPNQSKHNIKLKPVPYRLAIDAELSEEQSVIGMLKIVNLSRDAGRLIFSHVLLNIMRTVFIGMGVTPCCILFIIGKTGAKKTTYSAFQTQLYDRDKGIKEPIRLNARIPAAETIISENYDCTVVLDDLFPTISSEIKRNQENTLIELTRIVGDNSGRAKMKGKEVSVKPPNCGVIVTGEYLVGTGSTAARLLPVRFTLPINNEELGECQCEPLVLSTFYNFFIAWYIENYYEIQELLKQWRNKSLQTKLGVHDRLQETFYCLESAYKLFLNYCVEKDFTSEKSAKNEYRDFSNLLTELIKEQDKRANQSDDSKQNKPDYLKLIRTMYKGNNFKLADSIKEFNDIKHDGLIYNNCLNLREKKLMEKIHKIIPNANFKDVVDILKSHHALKTTSEDNSSIQIYGTNGKRFYAIKLKKL